jgi:hypothetical protein
MELEYCWLIQRFEDYGWLRPLNLDHHTVQLFRSAGMSKEFKQMTELLSELCKYHKYKVLDEDEPITYSSTTVCFGDPKVSHWSARVRLTRDQLRSGCQLMVQCKKMVKEVSQGTGSFVLSEDSDDDKDDDKDCEELNRCNDRFVEWMDTYGATPRSRLIKFLTVPSDEALSGRMKSMVVSFELPGCSIKVSCTRDQFNIDDEDDFYQLKMTGKDNAYGYRDDIVDRLLKLLQPGYRLTKVFECYKDATAKSTTTKLTF